MTSVAELLKQNYNPGTLNSFLTSHGGYEGCDLIWSAVNSLGVTFQGQSAESLSWLSAKADDCNYAIVANVLNGAHWVLITGYNGNGMFAVHDPANFHTEYAYSGMVTESIYTYN